VRVASSPIRRVEVIVALCVLAGAVSFIPVVAQTAQQPAMSTVQGHVRDAQGNPANDAAVFLKRTSGAATSSLSRTTRTDAQAAFQFLNVVGGSYTLRAEKGGARCEAVPVKVTDGQDTMIDLVLSPPSSPEGSSGPQKGSAVSQSQAPEFFDKPQFTVAGVTQATSAGGHGSDTVLRNSEALVKATVSLGEEITTNGAPAAEVAVTSPDERAKLQRERAEIQAELHHEEADDRISSGTTSDGRTHQAHSDLHHELARLDEKLGDPLEAVREYQRAAELAPSEPHLFDWASELLAHRALDPAIEIFTKGNHLYPQSERMLIGLGVACYARGSYEQAAQHLASASDMAPDDPAPYLFMGKMQGVETVPSPETVERLARFQHLEPGNALANYYYAVGLWKSGQSSTAADDAVSTQAERLLQKAVLIDPRLGEAYLQLGVLYAQRGDYARAIPAYRKAIEASPELEETHYRLAQAYRRTGDEADAQKELQLHEQISKRAQQEAEVQRREIQQFVVSLRDRSSNTHEP